MRLANSTTVRDVSEKRFECCDIFAVENTAATMQWTKDLMIYVSGDLQRWKWRRQSYFGSIIKVNRSATLSFEEIKEVHGHADAVSEVLCCRLSRGDVLCILQWTDHGFLRNTRLLVD